MFTIASNNGATIQRQATKEVANLDARLILQTRIKVAEAKLKNTDKTLRKYIDTGDARRELDINRKNYDRTCPETLSNEAKNFMWKRAKQLKDEFVVGMLSFDELQPIKGIQVNGAISNVVDWEKMSTNRTVERNTDWYKKNDSKIVEYKNIMRQLCPNDPKASDIERFRPRRKTI